MKLHMSFMIIILLVSGCSKNGSISNGGNSDDVIKSQLVGSWQLNVWYNTSYMNDNTFIDSSFVQSKSDSTKYIINIVRKGKYSITNAILERTDVQYTFVDSTRYPGGLSEIPIGQEIQIIDNVMTIKAVDVLTLVQGSGKELWGTWSIIKCVYHRLDGPPLKVYDGRQKEIYTFTKDSTRFAYGNEYLDGNQFPNSSFTSEYSYSNPKLDLIGFANAGFNEEVQRSYQRLPLVLSNVIFFLVYC